MDAKQEKLWKTLPRLIDDFVLEIHRHHSPLVKELKQKLPPSIRIK
ncbi:hypothetical protein HanXRQr2_Chr16g0744341 [Helianthus annuus]|uniref:Uncharacterized protein n=1 Tax=Helianthus annuus TaxID=4232 RepID=A0A9K3GYD8_HELAN|nr:hypothetical protein HanXRQr2_Chr16g0744341 [Helianthus annuus]KAJ0820910.1 hypothetical protein HanPSC8_Chr16g0713691 [Helianthus annuus]